MTLSKAFVFDHPRSAAIVEARQALVRKLLPQFSAALELRTALDAGCGVGYFSGFLRDLGLEVMAFDARPENIEEARRRNREVAFHVADVEDPDTGKLGSFDFVLCFGLVYHLENPVRAFRNLQALTRKLLLVESICLPGQEPVLTLRDEMRLEDQGVNFLGCYPSESGLIKMAYCAGFPFVYGTAELPDHDDFRDLIGRKRVRTMIAASKVPLNVSSLTLAPEPRTLADPWSTDPTGLAKAFRRFTEFYGRPWPEKLSRLRRRYGPKRDADR
jgi:SAM-dependent methyltransferase